MIDRYKPALLVSGLTFVLLLVTSARYGYHRDELYFLEAGKHPAWGYPDQPPLTPLLARLMSTLSSDSLVVLRLPSTISAALVVLLAGVIAVDLGASRTGQFLASASTALCGFVLGTGHLLSTATTDILGWTLVTFLLVRLSRGADDRTWVLVGVAAGITVVDNELIAFLLGAAFVCLLVFGPRAPLRVPWFWVGAAIIAICAVPYLLWQAGHGWPQLDVANSIAAGNSTSSAPRGALIPLEILEVGPALMVVWIPGLVRLWRDRSLRYLAATFLLLQVVFVVLGGKPYYLAGLFPLLLAAGAQPVVDHVRARWVIPLVLVLSLPAIIFTVPVLPVRSAGLAIAVNPDVGETIAWPQYVAEIARAYRGLPPNTVIVADNYGEAGAVDHFGPALGLPHAYSGHNGYALWATPPDRAPTLLVGVDSALAGQSCATVRTVGTLHNALGIDNDENGTVLRYCVPAQPWSRLWPRFRHVG